jgi:hypothetical protein
MDLNPLQDTGWSFTHLLSGIGQLHTIPALAAFLSADWGRMDAATHRWTLFSGYVDIRNPDGGYWA